MDIPIHHEDQQNLDNPDKEQEPDVPPQPIGTNDLYTAAKRQLTYELAPQTYTPSVEPGAATPFLLYAYCVPIVPSIVSMLETCRPTLSCERCRSLAESLS